MNVIVIGGGPAGMMSAITASEKGDSVTLIEKMQSLGRKLLITGKGRCNITSSLPIEEFVKNTPGNGKFLYSAFKNYTNKDIIEFLEKQGLKVKEERGNRVFPTTDKSQDVLKAFIEKIKNENIKVKLNTKVVNIISNNNKVIGVEIEEMPKDNINSFSENIHTKENLKNNGNNGKNENNKNKKSIIKADKVILATGGKSYPLTGSTGDGYNLAKRLGHTVTEIKPSLVPLEVYEKNICKEMQGLSLKNVKIEIEDITKNKCIYQDFGEMIFTHFGVSGPIILSASAHLVRYKNIKNLLKEKKIKLKIDLKPALSEEKLDARIIRDFEELKNKKFKNSLDKLLPQKMINIIIKRSGIDPEKKVNEITKEERKRIEANLKNLTLEIKEFRPIGEAIITSGGIEIKEINPKTMESKFVKGLFFAGEIIDVDAYTGGFNLQIAYSTGFTAGGEF